MKFKANSYNKIKIFDKEIEKINIKDSFDYDFMQVMNAVYEQEYDGELGNYDLPEFPKTVALIERIWDNKYSDIDSWLDIPWTKEEKDKIFNSGKNEAKLFDRIDIYNSRARYQSYDETKKILKEIFGINNKYLNDSVCDSGLQLKNVHKGFAILLDKYYKKYGRYAFVEAVEPTPELASKTCTSLEICDKMKYIIIDCNKNRR